MTSKNRANGVRREIKRDQTEQVEGRAREVPVEAGSPASSPPTIPDRSTMAAATGRRRPTKALHLRECWGEKMVPASVR